MRIAEAREDRRALQVAYLSLRSAMAINRGGAPDREKFAVTDGESFGGGLVGVHGVDGGVSDDQVSGHG